MSARPSLAPQSGSRRLRLGFIGLGWIGRRRLDAIAERSDVSVAVLSDADAPRLDAAAAIYPDARTQVDFDAVLECDVDGVVIATPNANHSAQAIACLSRGIPVFCQKPLAIDAAETARVLEAAAAAERLLAVDYSYRHVRGMPELRRRIGAGELGEISAIDLVFHNAYGPNKAWCFDRNRSGGGCLLDLGIHLVDLASWLQGSPGMEVASSRLFSRGRRAAPGDIEDLAFVEIRQDNGALVRVACSWNAQIGCDAQISAQIHAMRGGALWRNLNGSFVNFQVDLFRGNTREELGISLDDWGPGALSAWIERLHIDSSFDPDAWDVLTGARLIEQAYLA